jgi:hypothetical protein
MAAASRSVMSKVDNFLDTKAFMNMRESWSEAELYSALNPDDSKQDLPAKDEARTMAWWQERAV